MGEHADAIAELEHEIGARHDVGVAAPHLDDDGRLVPRQIEVAQRPAHHHRARGEHAQVVEVAAILDEHAVRRLPEAAARVSERVLAGADREHDVVLGDHEVGGGCLITARPSEGHDLHAGRQRRHDVAQRLARQLGIAQGDFEQVEARGQWRLDLRLEHHEKDIEQQDRSRHPERIGDRVADRGIVIAERRDGCLERRRARPRSREQSQCMAEVQIHRFHEQDAHGARQEHSEQRHAVRLEPPGARQSEEKLLAVLHSHAVEKERETQRPNHRRRYRLGREPAHAERDEQHRTHTEREPLDVDFAHEIADGDREKQRHQRLLLEQRLDEIHVLPSSSRRPARGCGTARARAR